MHGRENQSMRRSRIACSLAFIALAAIAIPAFAEKTPKGNKATVTITMLYCVSAATGVDGPVNRALANLPSRLLPGQLGGDASAAIKSVVGGVPELINAIDAARQDPDDLYVTTDTAGGLDKAIWPGEKRTRPSRADQSHNPGIQRQFSGNLNISLWDYDSASRDDLLGSVTVLASEKGKGQIAKLAKNAAEGSAYYVVYRVD